MLEIGEFLGLRKPAKQNTINSYTFIQIEVDPKSKTGNSSLQHFIQCHFYASVIESYQSKNYCTQLRR